MMLKRRDDLIAEVIKLDEYRAAVERRVNRQIKKFLSDYRARVEANIRRPAITKKEAFSLKVAQRVADDLVRIMADAGKDDIIANYLEEFPIATKKALSYFEKVGVKADLAGVDRESLQALISFSEGTLRATVDRQYLYPVQEAVFNAAMANLDIESAIDQILARTDELSEVQARTLIVDSVAQYQRTVTTLKGEAAGLEIFIYEGPNDAITSDQCQALLEMDDHGLPGALYKDEISQDLHEALPGNPLITGGHVNCRHRYMPVTEDYAVSLGFEPRK